MTTGILISAAVLAAFAAIVGRLYVSRLRRHRELLEFLAKQVEELEESLSESRRLLETDTRRFSDQSRRIAWLETRVRTPKAAEDEFLDAQIEDNGRSTMTERRHRVLTLAQRGQDSDQIASMLGMMRGEVELIIGLNRSLAARSN